MVKNTYGSVTTNAVRMSLSNAKPIILTQPTNTTVKTSDRAYFTVKASGSGLSYQWQYSSDNGGTWHNSSAASAKSAKLDIAGSAANAKLLYRCVVKNTYGSVTTNQVKVSLK